MTLKTNESSDGTEVALSVGDLLELDLAETPTTGFRWKLSGSPTPGCVLEADGLRAPDTLQPGRPGRHWWKFRAAEPGAWHIVLDYGRSWASAPPARRFSLTVRVQPVSPSAPGDGADGPEVVR